MSYFTKRTVLQSFKLLITAKRQDGVIFEKDDLALLWDDYITTSRKQGLVPKNALTKWKNPYI